MPIIGFAVAVRQAVCRSHAHLRSGRCAIMPVLAVAVAIAFVIAGDGAVAAAAKGERARVVSVLDGDTVMVEAAAGGRQEVRLIGVEAPKPYPDGSEAWLIPYAEAARRGLSDLARGETVTLYVATPRLNRYGQVLADVYRADGLWLQGEMLRHGWVRVRTAPATAARATELLAMEAEARAAGRGLWAEGRFAVRTGDTVARDMGSFQIVEDRVKKAARVQNRIYLNFGDDWRRDFTVTMTPRVASALAQDGVQPLALAGRRLRVRGWVDEANGPAIEVTHPAQIEVLDAAPGDADLSRAPATPPAAATGRAGAPAQP
jgi:endonuclease YncB( thermonuclease family)